MIRRLTAISALAAAVLSAPSAHAQKQEFGDKGEFIISAERLVPFFSFSQTWMGNLGPLPAGETGLTNTSTQTAFSFFWGQTPPEETFFTVPRLGVDYAFAQNFTLGGDLVLFFTVGGSNATQVTTPNAPTQTISRDTASTTVFGVAPRAGYVLRFSNLVSLWLRGGLSFYTSTSKLANNNTGENQFALDILPEFVFTPIPHVGFTAGLSADIPLIGQHWAPVGADANANASSAALYIGATLGMLAHF